EEFLEGGERGAIERVGHAGELDDERAAARGERAPGALRARRARGEGECAGRERQRRTCGLQTPPPSRVARRELRFALVGLASRFGRLFELGDQPPQAGAVTAR